MAVELNWNQAEQIQYISLLKCKLETPKIVLSLQKLAEISAFYFNQYWIDIQSIYFNIEVY